MTRISAEAQARESYHAAAAVRDLARIIRKSDRKAAAARRLPDTMTVKQVCAVLQISRTTLFRKMADGRLPGPNSKELKSPFPVGSVEYFRWRRSELRWDGALIRAIAYGVIDPRTKRFRSNDEWQGFIRAHYTDEIFAV